MGAVLAREVERCVREYTPLVRKLAYRLVSHLPSSVDPADVIQDGMIGLLRASDRYQDGANPKFEAYASLRIKGAMIDGLRRLDWMPRELRRTRTHIDAVTVKLAHELGRRPHDSEVATRLHMPLLDYQNVIAESTIQRAPLDDEFQDFGNGFEQKLLDSERDKLLIQTVRDFPAREQAVLVAYYDDERTLAEIGRALGLTESRVCQIKDRAIGRLRRRLA